MYRKHTWGSRRVASRAPVVVVRPRLTLRGSVVAVSFSVGGVGAVSLSSYVA